MTCTFCDKVALYKAPRGLDMACKAHKARLIPAMREYERKQWARCESFKSDPTHRPATLRTHKNACIRRVK